MNADPDDRLIRSEEELDVAMRDSPRGAVRARKVIDEETVEQVVPVSAELADVERHAPHESDSGQVETLPDGSISIPVFEEELVVEKRLVVRERLIIRKTTVTEQRRVSADVRRERVEIETDDEVADRVHDAPTARSSTTEA